MYPAILIPFMRGLTPADTLIELRLENVLPNLPFSDQDVCNLLSEMPWQSECCSHSRCDLSCSITIIKICTAVYGSQSATILPILFHFLIAFFIRSLEILTMTTTDVLRLTCRLRILSESSSTSPVYFFWPFPCYHRNRRSVYLSEAEKFFICGLQNFCPN